MPVDPAIDATPETDDQPDALTLRRPDVPTTVDQLAVLKGGGTEIIQARVQILQTLRTSAIRSTHPEDWVLFKSPEEHGGQVVGFLQDAGCDRVRDLFGIEIFDISKPEKIAGTEPGTFHYVIIGNGRCRITGQVVESMEGGRSSTDDFCRDKQGADLELAVRKAARANLDGNITRELAGMKSVPAEELSRAWNGTAKTLDACRLGRGFGSRAERLGATAAGHPEVEPPVCPHCGTKGVYRPGRNNRPAFYGCPKFQTHSDKKWIVDAETWIKQQQKKSPAAAAPARPPRPSADERLCDVCGKRASDHGEADHDFSPREREPGEEG